MRTTEELLTIMREDETAFFKMLGERIAANRTGLGLTQLELAEQLGVTQQVVASYEVGRRRVPASLLPDLARTFGVSLEELVGITAPTKKPGPVPKLQRQIEQLNRIPKAKQKFVSEFLDTVLQQA